MDIVSTLLRYRSSNMFYDPSLNTSRERLILRLLLDHNTREAQISTADAICYVCGKSEPPKDFIKLKSNWFENAEPTEFTGGKITTVEFPDGSRVDVLVKQSKKFTFLQSKKDSIVPGFLEYNLPNSIRIALQEFNDTWISCENENCANDINKGWCHEICFSEAYKFCPVCRCVDPSKIAKDILNELYQSPPPKVPRPHAQGSQQNRIRVMATKKLVEKMYPGQLCSIAKQIEAESIINSVMKDGADDVD